MEFLEEKNQELPYNFFAEKLLIAAIVTYPDAILTISQFLPIDAFYIETHKTIYKAALKLSGENKPIDFVNLITWLEDNQAEYDNIDLIVIGDFFNQIAMLGSMDDYIALVYDKYLRRELIELGHEIIEQSFLTSKPIEKLFAEIDQSFSLIVQKQQTKSAKSTKEVLDTILEEIRSKLKNSLLPGLSTTFTDLDAITQGFHPADLIIVAGRPSMGKTAFSLSMAKNIAKQFNVGVAFFSLEMTQQQLVYRLLATETGINASRLRAGRVSKREWYEINKMTKYLSQLNFFIDDTPNITVSEIQLKVKKLRRSKDKNLGLVVIDYLQLLELTGRTENRVQEVSKITRLLKKLAREVNLPVIVLSQLSRNVETRTNKRPTLSDLRESGSIEQDADLVAMLYRDEYYNPNSTDTNIMEVIISKHRNGPVGTVKLEFNPQNFIFNNIKKE